MIFWCLRLQVVVVAALAFWLSFLGEPVEARETYQQFLSRILAAPPKAVEVKSDVETAIFLATNAYRKAQGLKPLRPASSMLRDAARVQAMDLLVMGAMGHVSSTGQDFESRMRALRPGQMFLPAMAENAARQTKKILTSAENANGLVQQWVKSSGHRKNMVDKSYLTIAIGAVQRGNEVYAVQIFMGPEVKTNLTSGQ